MKLLLILTDTELQDGNSESGSRQGSGKQRGEGDVEKSHSHARHIQSTAGLKADFGALADLLLSFTKELKG